MSISKTYDAVQSVGFNVATPRKDRLSFVESSGLSNTLVKKRSMMGNKDIDIASNSTALSEMSEEELVQECVAGSEAAFEEVVHRFKDYVYNFSYKLMKNPEDAEDLSQDVFLTCFRHFKKFRGDCRLSTWLYTITNNLAKNKWQKDKTRMRKMHISIDEPIVESFNREITFELPDTAPDPRRTVAAREEVANLEKCIERLSDEQQQLITLRFQNYLSYEEIAAVLDCSVGTVKSRLHRVRKELKILMSELVTE